MRFVKNNKKGAPWPVIAVWVLVAVVCIQGYLLLTKKPAVRPKPAVVKPLVRPPSAKVTGKIAVILDDWGFNRTHCRYLGEFDAPVTPAVLPNFQYSKDVLQCARSSGQEPMLHLPLEPHKAHLSNGAYPRGYILTTAMSQKEVLRLLKRILDEYPGIVGVNNHMGSKATEDKELMTTVLTELKRRGLFFVDSMTSAQSTGPQVAQDVGIPFARRAVFLDNRNERAAIERAFSDGARIAREKGFALLIGHDRELTLKILTEQIRKLKQQGYQFLSVKDFIKAARE